MKLPELVAVPLGDVTVIVPLVAPAGTIVLIEVSELTTKLAGTPLNCTDVTPVKWRPPIPTLAPAAPLPGVRPTISGIVPVTVKLLVLEPVPFGGGKGVHFTYRFTRPEEDVRRLGEAWATIAGGRLYMIAFEAPALHFFDAGIDGARAVVATARLAPAIASAK